MIVLILTTYQLGTSSVVCNTNFKGLMITIKEWTQIIFEVEIVFSRFSSEFAVFDSLRRYENAVENVKKSKQKQTWLYNDFQSTTLCPQSPLCMGDLPNYQYCLLSAKYLETYVFNLIVGTKEERSVGIVDWPFMLCTLNFM